MATAEAPVQRESLFELLRKYWKQDLLSGFLVFLIALPLCLAIAQACNFPPIAGVFTAIVGSMLTTLISNSELTIKGPAAGLIVIVLGAVSDFGSTGGKDPVADAHAYQMALGVGVAAGVIQILLGLFRAGVLSEMFPTSAVHGMLSAIGVIIMAKQIHVVVGQKSEGMEPFGWIEQIPHSFQNLNPEITAIGLLSLIILFGLPLMKNKFIKRIPAQMVVVLVSVPLGLYFGLEKEHTYSFHDQTYTLGPKFLVNVPANLFSAITHPDFSGLQTITGWKWVLMFTLIGSLESMLSAKAIDLIDPWRRKTDMNRDLLAVGVANTVSAAIGGLPMISEIVRSKANIDNGARSRWADFFHGAFLLFFVALLPGLLHEIPLAALAAMLIYTGFRLASPKEFMHMYKVGPEQLLIFVSTIVGVLATDLLIGIFIGIGVKILIHLWNGVPVRAFFKPHVVVNQSPDGNIVISVQHSAVFSSWLGLKRHIEKQDEAKEVVIDLSQTKVVDHTVMEKLHEMQREFEERDCRLVIKGLDQHRGLSDHPLAARKRAYS